MSRNEYALDSFDVWRRVLDSNMSYHNAEDGPSDNKFDNAVINTFKYFEGVKTVLDVGAGWGGPARILKQHLNLDITCLTNGEAGQVELLKKDFPVIHADANLWTGEDKWDMLVFFESFGHMQDETFSRFAKNADRVLFKDSFSPIDYYQNNWDLRFRTKETFFSIIEDAGFTVKDYTTTGPDYYHISANFWLNNIIRYEEEEGTVVTGHIATLKHLCQSMLYNPDYDDNGIALCTIYAEKNK